MELNLKGKKALITAGSYGLGYACAKSLAIEGAEVVICSRSDENVQNAVKALRKDTTAKVFGFAADLSSSNELEKIVPRAKELIGGIDILVACTGHPPTFPFSSATDEDWAKGIDIVLQPAIKLTRAVLPEMREKGFGRLIYIGSVFGLEPEVSSVIQSTLRTGLNGFSKCVAIENATFGVTANVICPGYFDTPLCRDLAKKYAAEQNKTAAQILEEWSNIAPVKKFGEPDDLGDFVSFLASIKAKFITGTSIPIDGGFLKQY